MSDPKCSEAWERWLLVGFSLAVPLIVLGIHYPFKGQVLNAWADLLVRLLFLGIVAWMRLALLPTFRFPGVGRWGMVLLPIVLLLLNISLLQSGGLVAVCSVFDCIITGILMAMTLETILAAVTVTAVSPKIRGRVPSLERLQHLRGAVDTQKRMVLALTVLILLSLYILARSFLFDWVLYARIGALLAGLGYVLPLMVLKNGMQRESEEDLLRIEKEVEGAIERQLFRIENGLEPAGVEELSFWLDYRRVLLQSTMIPLSWENWLYLLFLLLIILVEPYLFGAWMI
ncbi:MAG TPA: hypothetical protein VHR47_05255 [Bacillota bacterium]|nr:hypothetical protein [Bacillota bacterium]